jgi:WD40 repeat protein
VSSPRYDAFLSYTARSDYRRARRIESFLEGFHAASGAGVRRLQICRDGSDFRLPRERADGDVVWQIIRSQLEQSRRLLVLCSPPVRESAWVAKEIGWFLDQQRDADVLLAVTECSGDPNRDPRACFPDRAIDRCLHERAIWYDLRGLDGAGRQQARDAEDELVRLAGDLLDWDDASNGPLSAVWMREQARRRRRTAQLMIAVAAVLIVLAIAAIWQAVRSRRASEQARANAIVLAADAAPDPLTGVLLLRELAGHDEPADGTRVAQKLLDAMVPAAVLRGATAQISGIVFLGDDRLAAASADGTIRFWRTDGRGVPVTIAAGAPVVISAANDDASRLAFALGDGHLLVTDALGRVQLRDRVRSSVERLVVRGCCVASVDNAKHAELLDLGLHANRVLGDDVRAVHLDPGGRSGIVVTDSGAVDAFDAVSGIRVQRLPPSSDANEFAISSNGAWVFSALGGDATLRHVPTRRSWPLAHGDLVSEGSFSADSTRLVTACADGLLREWQLPPDKPPLVFDSGQRRWILQPKRTETQLEPLGVEMARFAPDGRHIAAWSADGVLRIWPAAAAGEPLELHLIAGMTSFAWSPSGRWLASGNDDGSVAVWPSAHEATPIVRVPGAIHAAAATADARFIAVVDNNGDARLWNVARNAVLPLAGGATACAWSAGGTLLATAHKDGYVRTWRDGKPAGAVGGGALPLRGVLFAPDGDVIAWSERTIFRWGRTPRRFDGPPSTLWAVRLSADGSRLLACYDDGVVIVWSAADPSQKTLLAGHRGTVYDGALSADGSLIVTVGKDGGRIWRMADPAHPRLLHGPDQDPEMDTCALSPDGKRIAVTTTQGRLLLYDAQGRQQSSLRAVEDLAHVGVINAIAFSPDGRQLVTGGGVDGAVRVWHADGSGHAFRLDQQGAVTFVAFTNDGRVVSASEDGTARIQLATWAALVAANSRRTTAALTIPQRMLLLGESSGDARKQYDERERAFGRLPLAASWKFSYPAF